MKKLFWVILVVILVAIVLALFLVPQFSRSAKSTAVRIESSRSYGEGENVVLRGSVTPNSSMVVFFSGNVGFFKANNQGSWSVNLGVLPVGVYYVQILADNSATQESVVTTDVAVGSEPSVVTGMEEKLAAALSLPSQNPSQIQLLPFAKNTPEVLQGKWNLVQ